METGFLIVFTAHTNTASKRNKGPKRGAYPHRPVKWNIGQFRTFK